MPFAPWRLRRQTLQWLPIITRPCTCGVRVWPVSMAQLCMTHSSYSYLYSYLLNKIATSTWRVGVVSTSRKLRAIARPRGRARPPDRARTRARARVSVDPRVLICIDIFSMLMTHICGPYVAPIFTLMCSWRMSSSRAKRSVRNTQADYRAGRQAGDRQADKVTHRQAGRLYH